MKINFWVDAKKCDQIFMDFIKPTLIKLSYFIRPASTGGWICPKLSRFKDYIPIILLDQTNHASVSSSQKTFPTLSHVGVRRRSFDNIRSLSGALPLTAQKSPGEEYRRRRLLPAFSAGGGVDGVVSADYHLITISHWMMRRMCNYAQISPD